MEHFFYFSDNYCFNSANFFIFIGHNIEDLGFRFEVLGIKDKIYE